MKIKGSIIKENQKMSTQFAWITTVLIAIVSLLIAVSVLNFFNKIMVDLDNKNKESEMYIASKIFDSIKETYSPEKKELLDNELDKVLKDAIIASVLIRDKKSGKIIYSIDGRRKFKIADKGYQSYEPEFISSKYYVAIGFYEDFSLKNYINQFLDNLSVLLVSSIFFGLLMAYFMFKIVSKPIEELTSAAEKYKHGNFETHIQKTNYEELNTLIDTYNSMGASLKELYTSLEMKVEERTVALENAYKELQDAQTMIVHSEKMRSLGELVAGITHEINNPVNFIYGNMVHLQTYSQNLMNLISKICELEKNNENKEKIENLKSEYDYYYIESDLPDLIRSCQEGAERTKNIIMDLKNFSRIGEKTISTINLENEIDITLNILHNKIKNKVEIIKDYAPDMPNIDALGGQLNQVFMNILDNATYAIKDKGFIKIIMRHDEKYVTIKIADNGCGMSQDSINRIFDPFYTTKPVGEGTGLGMSISYKIIKTHNGKISVASEKGKGTIFTIELPINNKELIKGA